MSLFTRSARSRHSRVGRRHASARLASSGATVSGTVSGPNSGDLTPTLVFLYNARQQTVTATALPIVASDGAYTIAGVPAGRWMAFCQPAPQTSLASQTYNARPGFAPLGSPIIVGDGQSITGVDFNLAPAGLLTVTVLDSTAAPVPGATLLNYLVDRDRLTTGSRTPPSTDATGSANLANVPLQSKLAVLAPNGTVVWWDSASSKERSKALVVPAQGDVLPVTVTLPLGA